MSRTINYFPDNEVSVYSLADGTTSFNPSNLSGDNVYSPAITPTNNPTAGTYGAHGTQTLASNLLFDCISPINNSNHKGGVVVRINAATNGASTGHYTLHTLLSDDHDTNDITNIEMFTSLLDWTADFSGIYRNNDDTKLTSESFVTESEDADVNSVYYVVMSAAFLRQMFITGHNALAIPMHPVEYEGVAISNAFRAGGNASYTDGETGGTASLNASNNRNWYGETRAMASANDSDTTITNGATIETEDGYTFMGYAKTLTDTPNPTPIDTIAFDGEKDVWYALFAQLNNYIITQAAVVKLVDRETGELGDDVTGTLTSPNQSGTEFKFGVNATKLVVDENGDTILSTEDVTNFADNQNPSDSIHGELKEGNGTTQSSVKTWYGAENTGWAAKAMVGFRLDTNVWTANAATVTDSLSDDGSTSTATYKVDGDAAIEGRIITAHYVQNQHEVSVKHLLWTPSTQTIGELDGMTAIMNVGNTNNKGIYVYGDTANVTCALNTVLNTEAYTFVGYKYGSEDDAIAPTLADIVNLDGTISNNNVVWTKTIDECAQKDTDSKLFAVWVKTNDLNGSIVLQNVHNYSNPISE